MKISGNKIIYALPKRQIKQNQFISSKMSREWIKIYEQELERLNLVFSQKPSAGRNVDTIYTKKAIDRIKQQMTILGQKHDFNHVYLTSDEFQDCSSRVRCVKRIVKLRFRCKNPKCEVYVKRENRHQKSYQLQNSWTTYYGLVEYNFFFDRLYRFKGQDPLLTHSFRVYKQRCALCKQWGKSGLMETTLEELINLYSLLVENIMQLRDQPSLITWRYEQKKGRINYHISPRRQDGKFHNQLLCQACDLGNCRKKYKEKVENKQLKKEQEGFGSQNQK